MSPGKKEWQHIAGGRGKESNPTVVITHNTTEKLLVSARTV